MCDACEATERDEREVAGAEISFLMLSSRGKLWRELGLSGRDCALPPAPLLFFITITSDADVVVVVVSAEKRSSDS